MQERGSPSVMSIRVVISVLVALFVISFGGVLLQKGGVFKRVQSVVQQAVVAEAVVAEAVVAEDGNLYGVVLSVKDDRFLHTKNVLTSLGIKVAQKKPLSFLSKEVDIGLERFVGSRVYHSSTTLKVWSNRMAFVDSLEEFVQDSSCTRNTWRFFFEDDLGIHPSLTPEDAKLVVAKGLELAEKDGVVYLGLCGALCTEPSVLDAGVEAARCAGTCAHAFGFQRWKAGEFLTEMSGLTLKGVEGPVVLSFYFDRYLFEYGNQVQKIWLVGSNLRSPLKTVTDHYGVLFQDRARYPSTIGK